MLEEQRKAIIEDASRSEPLFEIDGKPVYRGDILYHRDTFRTGGVVKAEFKPEGEYVTVRTVPGGAVPTVKVSELSFEIHEETKQQLEFEKNVNHLGHSRLSQRDRDFYDAGVKAARNQSNNVPDDVTLLAIAIEHADGVNEQGLVFEDFGLRKLYDAWGKLYTSPQQSNALEMAADVISRTLNTIWRAHTPKEGAKIVTDLQNTLKAIRNLIPQPERTNKFVKTKEK